MFLRKLYGSGFLKSRSAFIRPFLNFYEHPAIVFTYNRVNYIKNDPQQLPITPERFYDQMVVLKKNCTLLDPEDFAELKLKKKRFPSKSVLVTFDEGYRDNFTNAVPILETLGIKAIFFITSGYVGTEREFWWDSLDYLLDSSFKTPAQVALKLGKKVKSYKLSGMKMRAESYRALQLFLKDRPAIVRDDLIEQFKKGLGLTQVRSLHALMSLEELSKMSKSKSVVLGSHTHDHNLLSSETADVQKETLAKSKILLEKWVEKKVDYIAYPYGGWSDTTGITYRLASEVGYKLGFCNRYGQVHSFTKPFEIPRILVRDVSPYELHADVSNRFFYF